MPSLNYQQQLLDIDTLLFKSQSLWNIKAFDYFALPWGNKFPSLAEKVVQISDDNIDAIDSDHSLLLKTLLPALKQDVDNNNERWGLDLLELTLSFTHRNNALKDELQCDDADLQHFMTHIKGRKWQQIKAFTPFIVENKQMPILEWCAGKGHLGRLLAKKFAFSVTSLEWQSQLCDEGNKLAQKWQLPQQFICADVFDKSRYLLAANQHAIALHACGDLHVELIKQAVIAKTKAITFSPCCYHLIKDLQYQGLSSTVKCSQFNLTRHNLQLALQQSVIANQQSRLLRLQEIAWRLGFDNLQRDLRQHNQYLPLPTIKQSQLRDSFKSFCLWGLAKKNITHSFDHINFDNYEKQGRKRQYITRRIDLVAHMFRQILERYLLLDRVCFLEESGYQVKLDTFCDENITPRNAIICARL